MTVRPPLTRKVDEVIRAGPSVLLKQRGYRKIADSFYQPSELIRVVNFQRMHGNNPVEHCFTVNLLLVCPRLHELWQGTPFPKNPAIAYPAISQRLGFLMPRPHDHWWSVTASTVVSDLAGEVTAALRKYGLPWLERFSELPPLVEFVANSTRRESGAANHPKIVAAGLAAASGDKSRALGLVAEVEEEYGRDEQKRSSLPYVKRFESRIRNDL